MILDQYSKNVSSEEIVQTPECFCFKRQKELFEFNSTHNDGENPIGWLLR
jgi:hypothetical protein